MEYLRKVNFDLFNASDKRTIQSLFDRDSGSTTCVINCVKTPPGEGSPAGMHTHEFDQIFYIVDGTMALEIDGKEYEAAKDTLIVLPRGVPHKNWNRGNQTSIHLSIKVPLT